MARPVPKIIPGTRYGHLVTTGVYIPGSNIGNKKVASDVECNCDCGNITYKKLGDLKRKKNTTCGNECSFHKNKPAFKHGLSLSKDGKQVKEYQAWIHIKQKCNNSKHRQFQKHGGLGITFCKQFADSFECFLEYVGLAPSLKHVLRRINKEGNFEPGNMHWFIPVARKQK